MLAAQGEQLALESGEGQVHRFLVHQVSHIPRGLHACTRLARTAV